MEGYVDSDGLSVRVDGLVQGRLQFEFSVAEQEGFLCGRVGRRGLMGAAALASASASADLHHPDAHPHRAAPVQLLVRSLS